MVAHSENEVVVEFSFGLAEPELEDGERQKFAKKMLRELRSLDEVERAERTEDLKLEANSKLGFATLIGILTAHISLKNLKKFLEFLVDRLQDKAIKGKIKVGEKEVEFEVNSRYELAELEKTALKLVAVMSEDKNA